ncbi:uncharacterized protein PHACADRAFT_253390 [Phanerochaete carnosa HHB-10118-sp]|uniref:Uncharacterized protein n=1 Tax=Phanerochaete carnosa (strain HHB-10118-sp) TaxID=650164 RepID=K5X0Q3_PHACS|nr:uncharacterized protein PHACADRAFT_253390 [Phanerochaete carnosa HHB-10118-sp]EKM56322.1 hypothetical protein PHACADRAFT_253390 [Phanerochaete carnosa HHB-10118-sp]
MERFSWTDNLRAAFAPCLTCLQPRRDEDEDEEQQHNHHFSSRGPDYVPRARADELEGLLQDTDDVETLSLHSNVGRDDTRRRKRRKPHKSIRLFGFDLFGKPPIQLSEDEDDDTYRRSRSRTISASTLDSDAAPLDPSAIAQLSATRAAEGAAQRETGRLAKEERRRRRREKKAAREAALALALDRNQNEFEGFPVSVLYPLCKLLSYVLFQGSGPSYVASPNTDAFSSSDYSDEYGPFEHAPAVSPYVHEEADVDGADFGADVYAKRQRGGSAMSRSVSDSQSRTSGTDSMQHDHSYVSQQQQQPQLGRKKSSKRSNNSTTSQSLSISSPPAQVVSFPVVAAHDMAPLTEEAAAADAGAVITIDTPNGFPSVGFSGGLRRKNSEAGVFLARRGDE